MKKYNPTTVRTIQARTEEKLLVQSINLLIKEVNQNFRLIASAINQNTSTPLAVSSGGGGGGGGDTTIINNNFLAGLDYDEAVPTYVEDNPTQVIYKRGGSTVATETDTWSEDDLLVRTIVGEINRTWTFTYDRQGFFENVVKS